jgi:FlaA1/EpsC-like NDP-sugar epimerase
LLSYFSFPELRQVGTALGLAAIGLLALWVAGAGGPPRNVILVNALLSFALLSGFRVLLRRWRERSAGEEDTPANPPARVGIIGAGSTGAQLALELIARRNFSRVAVAFFDDDFQKWQKRIHDVPVVGMPECLLEGWTEKLDEVVIAMPDAPTDRILEITQLLNKSGLKFYSVSRSARFWTGQQAV